MNISLYKDYYGIGYPLYKKDHLYLKEGLTVLVGCNGSGKSTLLHQLSEKGKVLGIPVISYNNLTEGQNYAKDHALNISGDLKLLANLVTSSEGEQIFTNFGTFAQRLGSTISAIPDNEKEVLVLLDAVDSGLSLDLVQELKSFFGFVTQEEKKNGRSVYIVVSSNEYELCEGSPCLVLPTLEYQSFNNYEDYRKTILKSREYKDDCLRRLKEEKKRPSLDFHRDRVSHQKEQNRKESNPFFIVAKDLSNAVVIDSEYNKRHFNEDELSLYNTGDPYFDDYD